MKKLFVTLLLLLASNQAFAESNILFEGWFQVLVGTERVGYLVERYEFKNKEFTATTYLKTNKEGGDVTESLKAVSTADLSPKSYQYTSKVGNEIKIIDATFSGETMTYTTDDGKKKVKSSKRFKKGTFLSSMLIYVVLSQKNGLKIGNDFKYNAIAEEDATGYTGSLLVKNKEPVKGKPAIRLLNEFKSEKYFSWVTEKGETLLVRQPDKNIDLRFTEAKDDATENFTVNTKDLKLLFDKIPGEGTTVTPSDKPTPKKAKEKESDKPTPQPKDDAPAEKPVPAGTQAPIDIKGVTPPPSSSGGPSDKQ